MGLIRSGLYSCSHCASEFGLFVVWDWVYAQAVGVEPCMSWDFIAYAYKKEDNKWVPDFKYGVFISTNDLPGTLCESCIEQKIGRKLYWWDYKFISGNYSDIDFSFFSPTNTNLSGQLKSSYCGY